MAQSNVSNTMAEELESFLRNLHLNYESQLKASQRLIQQLQNQNAVLVEQLTNLALNEQKMQSLEEELRKNNQMIHNIIDLQNHLFNDAKYLEWIELKARSEKEETMTLDEKAENSLILQAQKARTYPLPSPFHNTPFRGSPFGG